MIVLPCGTACVTAFAEEAEDTLAESKCEVLGEVADEDDRGAVEEEENIRKKGIHA